MPKLRSTIIRVTAWLVAVAVLAGALWLNLNRETDEVDAYQERVATALLNFDVTWVTRYEASERALGGGLGYHPDGIFVAQKEDGGDILFLPADGTTLLPLGASLPPRNRAALPEKTPGGRALNPLEFRNNDIAVLREDDGGEFLLVSYGYFNNREMCITGRLARLPLPRGWLDAIRDSRPPSFGEWEVVFETSPCLPPVESAGYPFTGHQAGGQIAISPSGDIYLSVGDFGFDGLEGKLPPYPQRAGNSYGRVLKLTPSQEGPWQVETIAIGLRNPQGLDIDDQGRMWETEHGPMGGDELNLIRPGHNYGWPAVTLGVNYVEGDSDAKLWPFNPEQGRHAGFEAPVYAWVPSIAPSNVRFVAGLSPRWDGDLLVAALKQRAIVRLRLAADRVVFSENIDLGRRVRQVEIGHGRLYVLFDFGEFAILTPRAAETGYVDIATVMEEAYDPANPDAVTIVGAGSILAQRGCLECHAGDGAPSLSRVYGADIASQEGFDYSAALIGKEGAWNDDNLRTFLADTQDFAPGTVMPAQTLSDDDIAAIIEALRTSTAP